MQTETTQEVLSSNQNLQQAEVLQAGEWEARERERIASAKAYLDKLNQPQFPTITTAGEMLAHAINRGAALFRTGIIDKPFVLDSNNLDVYQQLASYFSGDFDTWSCALNPTKGVLIFGGYGCGKSVAMRVFLSNPVRSFRLVPSRAIVESFRLNGDVCEMKHRFANQSSGKFFGQTEIGLCIDDLGAERTDGKNFGNGFSIGDLIQDRYDNQQLRAWTHATTNATPAELREAYGPRVYDRLREIFNIVSFPEQVSRRS
jgi:predicted ATPase